MNFRIGLNQQLILRALQTLETKHGRRESFATRELIDAIWFEVERVSAFEQASAIPAELASKIRKIRATHDRVLAAKRRKGRKLRSERSWSLAVEAINPAQSLRRLIARGMIKRTGHTGRTLALTDAGRHAIVSQLFAFTTDKHGGTAG
jgi:hypothetical protein